MASKQHNFIVSAITRKIRMEGFKIIYFDGKCQDVDITRFEIPPKIINHRPDVIGENEYKCFCIGEAKTKNDLFNRRTRNQIVDFYSLIRTKKGNRLFIGIPLSAKRDLERLFNQLRMNDYINVDIIYVPDNLLPNETEI